MMVEFIARLRHGHVYERSDLDRISGDMHRLRISLQGEEYILSWESSQSGIGISTNEQRLNHSEFIAWVASRQPWQRQALQRWAAER